MDGLTLSVNADKDSRMFNSQATSCDHLHNENAASMLKALGHPVRLALVRQLISEACCCCGELCGCFNHSQSTISQHLSVLKEAGLLRSEKRGNQVFYSVEPDAMKFLAETLIGLSDSQSKPVSE